MGKYDRAMAVELVELRIKLGVAEINAAAVRHHHEAIDHEHGLPRPIIEFPFDGTCTVTNLVMSGMLERCRDLRIIVPPARGRYRFLARRIATAAARMNLRRAGDANGFITALQRFSYDTVRAWRDDSFASLFTIFDSSNILSGSD
jgi:hypothetical protein